MVLSIFRLEAIFVKAPIKYSHNRQCYRNDQAKSHIAVTQSLEQVRLVWLLLTDTDNLYNMLRFLSEGLVSVREVLQAWRVEKIWYFGALRTVPRQIVTLYNIPWVAYVRK